LQINQHVKSAIISIGYVVSCCTYFCAVVCYWALIFIAIYKDCLVVDDILLIIAYLSKSLLLIFIVAILPTFATFTSCDNHLRFLD